MNMGKGWGWLALVVMAPAWAADDRPLQVERESTRFVLNADGSFVQEQETAIKVLKDSALEAAKGSLTVSHQWPVLLDATHTSSRAEFNKCLGVVTGVVSGFSSSFLA